MELETQLEILKKRVADLEAAIRHVLHGKALPAGTAKRLGLVQIIDRRKS